MNIFEYVSRNKVRFDTRAGLISTEDLWNVPLTSPDNFSLDAIAQGIAAELKDTSQESFVLTKPTGNKCLTIKLDIVKHIIAVKLARIETSAKAAETKAKKARILELIMAKRDDAMKGLTEAELQKELDAL